jgi:hypothetical protein
MIQKFFERFGPVDRVLMAVDSKLKKFRGFCYIIMKTKQDFENILRMEEKIKSSKTVQEVQCTRVLKKNIRLFFSEKSSSSDSERGFKSDSTRPKTRKNSGGKGNQTHIKLSTSKQPLFSKIGDTRSDQELGENTLSPFASPLMYPPHVNFVYPKPIPE